MTTTPAPSINVIVPTGSAVGPWPTGMTYGDSADLQLFISVDDVRGAALIGGGVDYTVTGATPTVDGGAIVLASGLVPEGGWQSGGVVHKLIVQRRTVRRQGLALPDTEGHRPRATEAALDKSMRLHEEHADGLDRALTAPPGETGIELEPAATREGGLALFSGGGLVGYHGEPGRFLGLDPDGLPTSLSGTGADDALRVDLATGDGGLVAVRGPGAGARSRSLRGRVQEWASPLDYVPGNLHAAILAGTSTEDVTDALQVLFDENLTVFWGAMLLRTSDSLRLRGGTSILGLGRASRGMLLGADAGNVPFFRNATDQPADVASRDSDITIRGLHLDGDRAANVTATEFSHAVLFNAVAGFDIDITAANWRGDALCLSPARDSDTTIICSDGAARVRGSSCYRNTVSVVGGENLILDIISRNAGLCGVCLENDDGDKGTSGVRGVIGRIVDWGCNVDYLALGASARFDGNNGLMDSVKFKVVSIDSAGNGADWRGAKGLDLDVDIDGAAVLGLRGIDGTAVTSEVTLRGRVRRCLGRSLADATTAGGSLDVLQLDIAEGEGDLDFYIEGRTRGTLAGLRSVGPGGYLKSCGGLTLIRPSITGAVNALTLDAVTGLRIDGGEIGGSNTAINETGASSNNQGENITFSGAGCTVTGANSMFTGQTLVTVATWNPASVAAGLSENVALTFAGLGVGDMIDPPTFSQELQGMSLSAYFSAADTAQGIVQNVSSGARDLPAGTITGTARKRYVKAP